jgi:hypothetical protein
MDYDTFNQTKFMKRKLRQEGLMFVPSKRTSTQICFNLQQYQALIHLADYFQLQTNPS